MKIVFYENRYGGFIDRLIRFKTATWKERLNGRWKDLPSHCELLFNDNMMFSASQYENKVRFKKHSITGKAWCRIELPVTEAQEKQIKDWCNKQIGKKYDYLGVIGFVLPFIKQDPNKWFCSEVCSKVLMTNTSLLSDYFKCNSAKISPTKLKTMVLKVVKDNKCLVG